MCHCLRAVIRTVFDNKVIGKVLPPSVDNRMFNISAQFTGAIFVLATFHPTVCGPEAQVTAVLGELTMKGPAVLLTLNANELKFIPPPPALLSLTVNRKLRFLVYDGKISPMVEVLFKRSLSLGKVLVVETTGENDLKIGAFPTGAVGRRLRQDQIVPSSTSMNLGVSVSVAEPVNSNGVLIGIVKPPAGTL
jgi:hypothetical protein